MNIHHSDYLNHLKNNLYLIAGLGALLILVLSAVPAHATAVEEIALQKLLQRADFLAAQGYGLLQDDYKPEQKKSPPLENLPDGNRLNNRNYDQQLARLQEEIDEKNAEAAEKSNQFWQHLRQKCAGNYSEKAWIGMSETNLRQCCQEFIRGNVTQVVKVSDDRHLLRLYLLGYKRKTRMYVLNEQLFLIKTQK